MYQPVKRRKDKIEWKSPEKQVQHRASCVHVSVRAIDVKQTELAHDAQNRRQEEKSNMAVVWVACCAINRGAGCSVTLFLCQHWAVHPLDWRTHTHTYWFWLSPLTYYCLPPALNVCNSLWNTHNTTGLEFKSCWEEDFCHHTTQPRLMLK